MPDFAPAGLAMPQLFTHTYDIDALLRALCSPLPPDRLWAVDSRAGTVEDVAREGFADGSHLFGLEPLPASYMDTLKTHPKLDKLGGDDRALLLGWLEGAAGMGDLVGHFDATPAGGWLRERVKETALDWLDARGMIPPSMRHVKALSPSFVPPPVRKVTIG